MFENYILPTIVMTIYIIAFVVGCTLATKNKTEEQKMLPIKIAFFALIGWEVFKIFYLIHQNGYYDTSRYPLVFCSAVMYTYPLFCFKKNRLSNAAMAYSVIPSIIVYVLFVATQSSYRMSLIQGHSYFYHGTMLAVAIYLMTSGLYKFKFKDFFSLTLMLGGYVAFATVLSIFLKGNICIFGPSSSYLGFLYNYFGYAVGNLLLVVVIMLLCFAVYGVIHLCSRKKTKPQVEEAK